MSAADDNSRLFRYLLGDVTPSAQEEIERRYFSDPEYLSLVDAAEDDLIDAYVRRDLSQADRERFEGYFLRTRKRRDRVKMAEALLERAETYGLERISLKEGGDNPYAPDPVRFCREVLPLL